MPEAVRDNGAARGISGVNAPAGARLGQQHHGIVYGKARMARQEDGDMIPPLQEAEMV